MITRKDIIKYAMQNNDVTGNSIEKPETDAIGTGAFKTDCTTGPCKRITPKLRLTWCNVKTILLLALAIYFWLAR